MYNQNNVFAQIIQKKIPCKKVYEDRYTLIFYDIKPIAPIHLLAIPKKYFTCFDDFMRFASPTECVSFFSSIQKVTKKLKIDESGYRLVANNGKNAIQTVDHFHFHIIAGSLLRPLINENAAHPVKETR